MNARYTSSNSAPQELNDSELCDHVFQVMTDTTAADMAACQTQRVCK